MFAALVRMPAELRDGSGCGWCVRIRGGQLRQALNAVKSEHLPGVRTFCGNTGETLQEVGS